MEGLRDQFEEYPWLPALLVALFSGFVTGGTFFLAGNPELANRFFSALSLQDLIQMPSQMQLLRTIQVLSGFAFVVLTGVTAALFYIWYNSRDGESAASVEGDSTATKEVVDDQSNGSEAEEGLPKQTPILHPDEIDWRTDLYGKLFELTESGDVIFLRDDLSTKRKIIIFLIAKKYAKSNGLQNSDKISLVKIAKGAEISQNSAKHHLDELVEKGYVEVVKDPRPARYSIEEEEVDMALREYNQ